METNTPTASSALFTEGRKTRSSYSTTITSDDTQVVSNYLLREIMSGGAAGRINGETEEGRRTQWKLGGCEYVILDDDNPDYDFS